VHTKKINFFVPGQKRQWQRVQLEQIRQGQILVALKSMEPTKFQECFPEAWKSMQDYKVLLAKQKEAEIEAARVANLPSSKVVKAYGLYTMVKYCNQVREGYLGKYVNDVEMERAETVIRAIIDKAKAEDPTIDTDKLWSQAQRNVNGQMASQSYCEMYYNQLLHMSPVSPYNIQKPM
jgi:hypothetical protein